MAVEKRRDFLRMIGRRIKTARLEAGLSQEILAEKVGFKDRQILSAIEVGTRKVSTEEMMTFMRILKKDLDYFTDPLLLIGEGAFSWRAEAPERKLCEFEFKTQRWIAAYRYLGEKIGELPPLWEPPRLPLGPRNSYEEAADNAERLGRAWNLGNVPAKTLPTKVEEELQSLVLHVDAPAGISGAARKLPIPVILINRAEPEWRRSFDLGHELFHLLTWHTMPPDPVEPPTFVMREGRRMEQLANNFAAALLMPAERVTYVWSRKGSSDITRWLNQTAKSWGVSSQALKYRLKGLNLLDDREARKIEEERLSWHGESPPKSEPPKRFSKIFVQRFHDAIDRGFISARKAAEILDLSLAGLADLMQEYELTPPFAVPGTTQ